MSVTPAARVGFDSAATFRHHFTRVMRTSPSAYRRAFRAPASSGHAKPRGSERQARKPDPVTEPRRETNP